MNSLFKISEELKNLYATIEENDGEITEDVENALIISEDNLKDKLFDYGELIKQLNADLAAIDVEAKRIKSIKESKTKLLEKLNNAVADAVTNFGETTKSGGKYIDLGTEKISVRFGCKCEVNDDLVNFTKTSLVELINRLKSNGMLGETSFTDRYLELLGNGFDGDDIANIDFNINFTGNLLDLCNGNKNDLLKLFSKYENNGIEIAVSKSKCKDVIKNGTCLSFANNVESKSVSIK